MKTWDNGDIVRPFLTSALDGGEFYSPPVRFTSGGKKDPDIHWIVACLGANNLSDCCGVKKKFLPLPGLEPWASRPQSFGIQTALSQFS
jgi:hypothetical protein